MFRLLIEEDFKSNGGRKRKTKRKKRMYKTMIYVEYIN